MTDEQPEQEEELEIELSDEDIFDAMQHIQGYVDIFANDFRLIYHYAHRHAIQRLTGGFQARQLMRRNIPELSPEMALDEAARFVIESGYNSLPVTESSGRVIGILTSNDFLKQMECKSHLELLLRLMKNEQAPAFRWHETPVREAMTAPAVCVSVDAGFKPVFHAFRQHKGRSMPVVNDNGHLQGLLLRKDFLTAVHLENLL